MKLSKLGTFFLIAVALVVGGVVFHNCARAKFINPDVRHSAFALGLCRPCSDESGSGVTCRSDQVSSFNACLFESCNPGFELKGARCVPVVCVAGAIADCAIEHGEGRMTCLESGNVYGACTPISCDSGFEIQNNLCVATVSPPSDPEDPPSETPICTPNSHRDCSNESTYGSETCNESGSEYAACVLAECKPGYHKDESNICVANLCDPNTLTPCTMGAGSGFKMCNSIGSSWGVCELNGCQSGYLLKNGVCVVQVCTPGEESVCEFHNGSGLKTCNSEGLDYGACVLYGCQHGYGAENGRCIEHICTPSSQATCQGESGSGQKYCYENGKGFGPCTLRTCDPGFKLKNGQCVVEAHCDAGETLACTEQNGSGLRTCNTSSNRLGPCVVNQCNAGYELVNQGGSSACKKTK
ncbi:MAG: hypothetical protein SGJ18_08525 [Pseudomonadota bacterium]|nr:hypothetical protein [Pseudomonadota bacterium]